MTQRSITDRDKAELRSGESHDLETDSITTPLLLGFTFTKQHVGIRQKSLSLR